MAPEGGHPCSSPLWPSPGCTWLTMLGLNHWLACSHMTPKSSQSQRWGSRCRAQQSVHPAFSSARAWALQHCTLHCPLSWQWLQPVPPLCRQEAGIPPPKHQALCIGAEVLGLNPNPPSAPWGLWRAPFCPCFQLLQLTQDSLALFAPWFAKQSQPTLIQTCGNGFNSPCSVEFLNKRSHKCRSTSNMPGWQWQGQTPSQESNKRVCWKQLRVGCSDMLSIFQLFTLQIWFFSLFRVVKEF